MSIHTSVIYKYINIYDIRKYIPEIYEALSPGADRKWQQAGLGARVVVDGCHHSGGADDTVGGQASI